jgi:hypothetical protein
MSQPHLAFSISGSEATPTTVSLRDLLFLLAEFETAIVATAKQVENEEPDAFISLAQIRQGSAVYDLSTNQTAQTAAARIAEAIKTRNSEGIPQQAVDSLNEMHKRAGKRAWALTINNGSFSSTIQPAIPLFADSLIHGSTTILGYLNRVGGTRPTAKLKLPDGRNFTAEVPSQEFAKQLAHWLYKTVILEGEAWWHANSMDLRGFRIRSIGRYDDSPAASEDAISALRSIAPGLWDDVDPDEYIRAQRSTSD